MLYVIQFKETKNIYLMEATGDGICVRGFINVNTSQNHMHIGQVLITSRPDEYDMREATEEDVGIAVMNVL